jgi:hypothetical protein
MKLDKDIEPFRATIEAMQRLLEKFDNLVSSLAVSL